MNCLLYVFRQIFFIFFNIFIIFVVETYMDT